MLTKFGFLRGLLLSQTSYKTLEAMQNAKFHEPVFLIRNPSCPVLRTLAVQGEFYRTGRYVD